MEELWPSEQLLEAPSTQEIQSVQGKTPGLLQCPGKICEACADTPRLSWHSSPGAGAALLTPSLGLGGSIAWALGDQLRFKLEPVFQLLLQPCAEGPGRGAKGPQAVSLWVTDCCSPCTGCSGSPSPCRAVRDVPGHTRLPRAALAGAELSGAVSSTKHTAVNSQNRGAALPFLQTRERSGTSSCSHSPFPFPGWSPSPQAPPSPVPGSQSSV